MSKREVERLKADMTMPRSIIRELDALEECDEYSHNLIRWSKEAFARGRAMGVDYDTIKRCVILWAKDKGYSNTQISSTLYINGFKISPSKIPE